MASMPSIKSREIRIAPEVPINRTLRFWEGLEEGRVYASKCKGCGQLRFPPVADCPSCLSQEIEWVDISGEAEIETFTHVVAKPESFKQDRAYTIAIGKLKEGVKVLAWLVGFKMTDVKIGMKARLTARTTPEGTSTYQFVPP
jgi:uncharacterized OB-fold protein